MEGHPHSGLLLLHAHFVCLRRLSARTLHEACREAVADQYRLNNHPGEGDDPTAKLPRADNLLQQPQEDHDIEAWIGIIAKKRRKLLEDEGEPSRMPSSTAVVLLDSVLQILELLLQSKQDDGNAGGTKTIDVQAIVGTLWCLDRLGILTVSCSPIPVSPQTVVDRRHLFQDLPVEIVGDKDATTVAVEDDALALLRVLLQQKGAIIQGKSPPMTLRFTTSGSNGITLLVGERLDNDNEDDSKNNASKMQNNSRLHYERPDLWRVDHNLTLLETNIDDMTAEHLSFATELLMQQAGVADCWLTPIWMKKGRAAHTLHCLYRCCSTTTTSSHQEEESEITDVLRLLFQHTTTLGVRVQSHETGVRRVSLRRTMLTVPIEIADGKDGKKRWATNIDCKIGYLGSDIVSVKAEFDQCKKVALDSQQSVQSISDQVIHRARSILRAQSSDNDSA